MSTQTLRAMATGQAPAANQVAAKTEKPKDIAHLLASPAVQMQIKAALPRHMTAERMARIATTEMRKTPKLGQCEPMSFLGAVIQCAQLGLEPGNALGHAYILPYDRSIKVGSQWTKRTEAQVIIGYRGMIDLARRSGQIISIDARPVYEGDNFECRLGLDPTIEHTPDWKNPNRTDPTKLIFVYSVAKLKDGGVQFDVMSRAEIDAIMVRSQGYQFAAQKIAKGEKGDNPWLSDYAAMALKTVVRRLFKFLPVSIELARAVTMDEQADLGQAQENPLGDGMTIDNETGEISSGAAGTTGAADSTIDTAFDPALMLERIAKCTDLAVLQMIADDVDYMPDGPAKNELLAAIAQRDKEITKK